MRATRQWPESMLTYLVQYKIYIQLWHLAFLHDDYLDFWRNNHQHVLSNFLEFDDKQSFIISARHLEDFQYYIGEGDYRFRATKLLLDIYVHSVAQGRAFDLDQVKGLHNTWLPEDNRNFFSRLEQRQGPRCDMGRVLAFWRVKVKKKWRFLLAKSLAVS